MKLLLDLVGELGHSWPILTIEQNNKLHEYEIIESKVIEVSLDNSPFTLGMRNKLFGENRIWDTKSDKDGNIIADKVIQIKGFMIDEVDVVHLLSKMVYSSKEHSDITVHDAIIRFNGCWKFPITENPYDWIIDMNTQRTNEYRDVSYFSDYTIVNNYSEHYHFINKIKQTLGI